MKANWTLMEINYLKDGLLDWHKSNYRHFPWRIESSPYKIMIAEFMLQRTRANQVLPVYIRFIEEFPTIEDLSKADIEKIKKLIEPLGLKWRANHFKKAAKFIVDEYYGNVPADKEELLNVPGIGEYVAGAVLAIAYHKSECIVDSNIARVLNRYFGLGLEGEIRRKKQIVELSCELFKCNDPKNILFAIIDFSALICIPINPKHEICPLKNVCKFLRS